jgi:hypothetical protein
MKTQTDKETCNEKPYLEIIYLIKDKGLVSRAEKQLLQNNNEITNLKNETLVCCGLECKMVLICFGKPIGNS